MSNKFRLWQWQWEIKFSRLNSSTYKIINSNTWNLIILWIKKKLREFWKNCNRGKVYEVFLKYSILLLHIVIYIFPIAAIHVRNPKVAVWLLCFFFPSFMYSTLFNYFYLFNFTFCPPLSHLTTLRSVLSQYSTYEAARCTHRIRVRFWNPIYFYTNSRSHYPCITLS